MKNDKNDFKFRFKKHPNGRIVKFDLKQLEPYRIEARHDFLCTLRQQLKKANQCEIFFEREVQLAEINWVKEINEKENGRSTCFLELILRRAINDYCQYSINICAIQNYRIIMSMFEFYYEQKETGSIKQFI